VIDLDAPTEGAFPRERQDLEEMVGNLVDNACQVGRSAASSVEVVAERADGAAPAAVRISSSTTTAPASPRPSATGGAPRPPADDIPKPGSGLGCIVLELAALTAATSISAPRRYGGLRAEQVLPAV